MTNPAQKIIQAGFALRVVGDKIAVTPVGGIPISDKLRAYVKANRAAILASLTVPTVPCGASLTAEAANDGPPPATAPALPPAPPAPALDPDRACWPHSPAMNGAEVDLMVQRLALFEAEGMSVPEAEAEADRLMRMERTRSSPGEVPT